GTGSPWPRVPEGMDEARTRASSGSKKKSLRNGASVQRIDRGMAAVDSPVSKWCTRSFDRASSAVLASYLAAYTRALFLKSFSQPPRAFDWVVCAYRMRSPFTVIARTSPLGFFWHTAEPYSVPVNLPFACTWIFVGRVLPVWRRFRGWRFTISMS